MADDRATQKQWDSVPTREELIERGVLKEVLNETPVPIEGGIDWAAVEAAGGHRPTVGNPVEARDSAGLTATESDALVNRFLNPASTSLAPPVSEEAKMARKAERDSIIKTLGQKLALVEQDVAGNPQWSAADASKHLQRGQVYYELINELRGTPVNTQPKR